MITVDLNRISIVGLLIAAVAVILLIFEVVTKQQYTVSSVFGSGAPMARVSIWMVVLVVAAIVYCVGRVLWLAKNRIP